MTLRCFLPILAAAGTVSFQNTAPAQAPLPSGPNFVVILIDDMGYGDIGPFGSKLNRTPNLDRMASEGMKLTSFYGTPVCTPSRAQILTGCYAKRVSLPDVIFPACPIGLSPKEHTVAELLKARGYDSLLAGTAKGSSNPTLATAAPPECAPNQPS